MVMTSNEMDYFGRLQEMSEEELMQELHTAVSADDEQRIALIESIIVGCFDYTAWKLRYAAKFPDQTYYQFPGNHLPKPMTQDELNRLLGDDEDT